MQHCKKKIQINGLRIALLLCLAAGTRAAPKPFACMSFMENDRSLLYDDDLDEDSSAVALDNVAAENGVPYSRVCQADYTFCFSLWRQIQNSSVIEMQGCWKESTERNASCSQKDCTSSAPTSRNSSQYYCCCSGHECNKQTLVVEPAPLQLSKASFSKSSNLANAKMESESTWPTIVIWFLALMCATTSFGAATCYYFRSSKEKSEPEEAPLAPSGPGYSSNLRNVDNMNLICMLGNGKYGTVMKGLLHDKEVAVKIFPEVHHQYYINERNIYSLPLMDSPSLLNYFGYDERHTMDGKVEYQLVLSLAPHGCLQDWLIANEMNFDTFCLMSKSITRGLSHLHTELKRGDELKPCVAHRDLNTRNVLVNADLSCCIADFGFALKVFGSKYEYKGEIAMAETKSINEVGTLRYMAPELLEGAVNLRDCETSLKQMDVYALGLVLWEVATRCSDLYPKEQVTPPYKAPYELEVGAHPTFDQMQSLVVRHKARPLFPAGWGGGAAAKLIKDTCEDCWDNDAEARLTSLCAEERMQEVAGLRPRSHALACSPLLNTNNLSVDMPDGHQTQARIHATDEIVTTVLSPPPNQQLLPNVRITENRLEHGLSEKNHFMHPQQQLQPYQGRNPCQERNLAPSTTRPMPVLVEKSKKHSFQTGQENSFSCLENDVSVEDLISGESSKKFSTIDQAAGHMMGQGFPKKHNTDKKLRGWHGVRALIQKKLFRKEHNNEAFRHLGYGDEKSNLVDNRYTAAVVKDLDSSPPGRVVTLSSKSENRLPLSTNEAPMVKMSPFAGVFTHNRRPNNLDLSPGNVVDGSNKLNAIHSINEEPNGNMRQLPLRALCTRDSTPAHVVPRSLSTSLIKQMHNNNNQHEGSDVKLDKLRSADSASSADATSAFNEHQVRRQRSLEVFREVFSGRGSTEKLRDPSQRVKTPGDVPPSVRKVRASKTLSLYDDRMMDSSMLNIL